MQTNAAATTLQRQCACASSSSANDECASCNSGLPLQAKLTIGASDDPLEQEADRVAEQVLAMPANPAVSAAPPRIQRYAAQASEGTGTAPASVDRVLASSGSPLEPALQQDMSQRFGHNFSRVRVHSDSAAEQSAKDVNAHAYTVGHKLVFDAGQFAPETHAGRRLLAHELTHVVQQQSAAAHTDAATGTTGPDAHAIWAPTDTMVVDVPAGALAEPVLQRELDDGSTPAEPVPAEAVPAQTVPVDPTSATPTDAVPAQAPPGTAPPVPTLTLNPVAPLTRGDALTATVGFTPQAGETMRISAWRYATASGDTVTRVATEPTFQTAWSGPMALTGTLAVDYAVAPAGGPAGATATLSQAVTVADRSGSPWASSPTLNVETPFSGMPNPPVVFSDLGVHNANITLPVAVVTAVTSGPNTSFGFVGSLTAGTYRSSPRIHPALSSNTSAFFRFHQNPSRLYFLVGTVRTLIPLTEYSNLAIASGTLTFDVPDWEVFYKAKHYYDVTATGNDGSGPVPVRNPWWGLESNAATASLSVRNAPAIRTALGIDATVGFSLSSTSRGSWNGFRLMPSAAILTGTQSHEYVHATHSHRANFTAMLRAVDPQRKVEQKVSTPATTVIFATEIANWVDEILRPNHELVDEAASRTAGAFVATGSGMAGVNTDPATGAFLGTVWNITGDNQMT